MVRIPTRLHLAVLALTGIFTSPAKGQADSSIILATTTSTFDSGLLDSLVPMFEQSSGIRVKVIAVGTGAALEMARRGDADAVLVHAPALEREYVASGDLTSGRLVMHNDFVLVGPPEDPARVAACRDVLCAMHAIARHGMFVSRGDRSGTYLMELALWKRAGLVADSVPRRVETGQGMGATLEVAEQRRSYTLTDRGTFQARPGGRTLTILFQGDPELLNIYHAYVVNPGRHPDVKAVQARRFVAFLISPAGQAAIERFGIGRFKQSLFFPDATRDSTTLVPMTPN